MIEDRRERAWIRGFVSRRREEERGEGGTRGEGQRGPVRESRGTGNGGRQTEKEEKGDRKREDDELGQRGLGVRQEDGLRP